MKDKLRKLKYTVSEINFIGYFICSICNNDEYTIPKYI